MMYGTGWITVQEWNKHRPLKYRINHLKESAVILIFILTFIIGWLGV